MSAVFDMSPACAPPVQPSVTDDERAHPRYPEYARYRQSVSRQLVTGCNFQRWLADTIRDEQGFTTVFEVTSPLAQLAMGWWRNEFGPKHKLIKCHGPFTTKQEAKGEPK